VDGDPDAIWKPGFTGEVVYERRTVPERWRAPPGLPAAEAAAPRADPADDLEVHDPAADPSAPPSHRAGATPWRAVGVTAAVVVAAALAVAVTRSGGRREDDSSAIDRIPTTAAAQWSTSIGGDVTAVTGTDDVVVAVADATTLTAVDRRTGSVRWSRTLAPLQVQDVTVVDGVVVAATTHAGVRFGDRLIGVDAGSGDERWRLPLADNVGAWMDGHEVIVPHVRRHHPVLRGLDLIDPHTGATVRSITGDDIGFTGDDVQVRDGDTFRVYDLATFEPTAVVVLPALRGEPARIVTTAAGTLAVTSSQAALFDERGALVSSVPLGPSTADYVPFSWDLHGIVVVQIDDVVKAVTVRDGRVEVAWSRRGNLLDRTGDGERARVAVMPPDGPLDPMTGALAAVWEASTGATIWTGKVPTRPDGFDVLTGNGFVAEQATGDSFRRAIAGIGLDGTVLWRHRVRRGSDTALVDGAVIELGPTPGRRNESTLTLFG
jgi:hypothetical protein